MKSIIKLSALLLAFLAAPQSKADNTLSINNLTMAAGESAMVDVYLDNTDQICGFNMSIAFPDGFSSKGKIALTAERDDCDDESESTKSTISQFKDQKLVVIVYDGSNSPFIGNTGSVCRFNITAAADIAPGEYTFAVTNASVSDPDATDYETPDFTFTVTITESVVDTTGIARVAAGGSPASVYTLQGVRVDSATTLPFGIYIRNGHKVVIGK